LTDEDLRVLLEWFGDFDWILNIQEEK